MPTQDNLVPVNNPLDNIDTEFFKQNPPVPQFDFIPKIPEPLIRPNPIHETNRILENQNEKIDDLSDKLETANKELQFIHYENMKLNAQIEVLNKTIDFQNEELERLRSINAELKSTNQILKDNSRHSTRNAILLAIGTGVILIAIEHWYDIYSFILPLVK